MNTSHNKPMAPTNFMKLKAQTLTRVAAPLQIPALTTSSRHGVT